MLSFIEWVILAVSLIAVCVSFLAVPSRDVLTLFASLAGVVALIFVAKGDPLGQILTVVFAILYSIVSVSFRYYGEMITYAFMSAPMAALSAISWFRHPYKEGKNEVRIESVSPLRWAILSVLTSLVTFIFYFILKFFGTANLPVSTLSIATSFLAASLTFLRSPYYALAYAANDVVLIVMWILASLYEPSYFPMIICFAAFLLNDIYGFFNWRRMRRRQARSVSGESDK